MSTAPPQVNELVFDALVLPFARQMLEEHGEFHPYGAFTRSSGEIVAVSVVAETGQEMTGAQRVTRLLEEFTRMASEGEIVCCAAVCDFRLADRDPADAIRILVEHRDGYAAAVFVPYRIRDGAVEYEPMFATRADRTVFS